MKAHILKQDVPRDEWTDTIAHVHPASPEAVETVMDSPVETGDGRSEWVWVRLPNGDLILGVFPQGATYEAVEQDAAYKETP